MALRVRHQGAATTPASTTRQVEQAYAGYVYGESCSGHRAVYGLGLTGIPVFNVNSNCSTGSSALFLAAQAIRGGLADCTLAIGFEKMQPGSLGSTYDDREQPMAQHLQAMAELQEFAFPVAPWMFGAAGIEHNEKYGSTPDHFAKIAVKNHQHSANNPYSQFQDVYTEDQISDDEDDLPGRAADPADVLADLGRLGRGDTGRASAFVDEHGLAGQAVEIVGQALVTDAPGTFEHRKPRAHSSGPT